MNKIVKYVFMDILKNRFTIIYTLLLLLITCGMFFMDNNPAKALLSLFNLVILFVPLIAVMFTTTYYYNTQEFIVLLLAQPIKRAKIFLSVFTGITASLILAFVLGAGIPLLILQPDGTAIAIVLAGILLNIVFVALAIVCSVYTKDKARGMGVSILLWLFFMLIYDGIVLLLMFTFSDYPMEKMYIALSLFNPIDLARIVVLLQLDISALMGITGAVFKDFFGSSTGVIISLFMLLTWCFVPTQLAARHFNRKDF